jgi:hypothetical protein
LAKAAPCPFGILEETLSQSGQLVRILINQIQNASKSLIHGSYVYPANRHIIDEMGLIASTIHLVDITSSAIYILMHLKSVF